MGDGDITVALQQVIAVCVELLWVTGSGLMIADEDNTLGAAVASDGRGRVPVVLGGVTIGFLDLYMDRPHRWDDSECDALARYSCILEATLAAALRARHSGEIVDQLQFMLDNRVVIDEVSASSWPPTRVDAVTLSTSCAGPRGTSVAMSSAN